MNRLLLTAFAGLALSACDSGNKTAAPSAAEKPSAKAEATPAGKTMNAPNAPAAPAGAAAPAAEAPKAEAPPAAAEPAVQVPVEADFEAEAEAQITGKTYKAELETIEKAIASEAK